MGKICSFIPVADCQGQHGLLCCPTHTQKNMYLYVVVFFKYANAIIRHSLSSSCHIHQAMLLTMLYIIVELLSNQISADRKDVSHGCANIFNYLVSLSYS